MKFNATLHSLVVASALTFSGVAYSAGSGSDSDNTNSPAQLQCKQGEIIKTKMKDGKKVKYCAPAEESALPDNELYEQGRALAKAGHYDWALQVLALVSDKNNPDVLNYMGYSHRKAGRIETGISFYRKALAINPNFVLAREYLGEGYVAAGRVDLAQVELNEIGTRCGVTCEEYIDLKTVIETATN